MSLIRLRNTGKEELVRDVYAVKKSTLRLVTWNLGASLLEVLLPKVQCARYSVGASNAAIIYVCCRDSEV
jgi:hypothetical protein